MMEVTTNKQIFSNLTQDENGIFTADINKEISYPKDGNQNCYQLEDNSYWFIHRMNIITALVKRYAPKSLFFDVGGGNGYVAKGLQDAGIESVLVEPGYDGCRNAKQRGVKTAACAVIEDCGLAKESIEAAGLFDVVEHIEDDHKFLKTIASLMKKDGYLFVTVPAYQFLWSADDTDGGHYRRYTSKTIKKVLIKSGFEPVFSSYIFSILILPIFLFRTIPSLLGLVKNISDPKKQQREFEAKKGILGSLLDKVFNREDRLIAKGGRVSFGSSVVVVAKKKG